MGKRSNFERKERDFYKTPIEGIMPLLPYLEKPWDAIDSKMNFIEPCAGDGALILYLEKYGHECVYACDIEPQKSNYDIEQRDVLFFDFKMPPCDCIITNTPWKREILHPMIDIFRMHAPTWLLFDADWLFTKQAMPYKKYHNYILDSKA